MNIRNMLMLGTACTMAGLSLPAFAQTATTTSADAADTSNVGLESIVVTARKRAESGQSVPVAITAFSPQALQEKQIVSLPDLARNTSGVSFQQSSTSTEIAVVIRGQNVLDSTLNLDAAIGIYVDGVYIGPQVGNAITLNFDDAASVEVLKGPQGTLYGRNTSGGALKLDHIAPQYETEGWGKVGFGNYGARQVAGVVNIPLSTDTAALRVYGRYDKRDGYGRNLARGTNNLNDENYSVAASLRLDPTPNLNILLRGTFDQNKNDGLDNFPTAILPTTNLATLTIALANGLPLNPDGSLSPATIDRVVDLFYDNGPKKRFDTNALFPNSTELRISSGTANIAWDVNQDIQIRSITSVRHLEGVRNVEFSGQIVPLIATAQPIRFTQFSEELNLNGNTSDNRLKYTLGLFYLHSTGRDENYSVIAPQLGVFLGANSPVPTAVNVQIGDVKVNSYAAYGQASYELADGLNLTGGLRYTKENKGLVTHNRFILGAYSPENGFVDVGPEVPFTGTSGNTICFEANQGVGDACFASQPLTFEKLTWLASVDYKIAPTVLVYAKTSRGFRSGGGQLRLGAGVANANNIPPFGPESVDDIELGVKSDFFDNKLRANVALYRGTYSGMQRTTLAFFNGAINSYVANAGKARVQGVEFELTARPIPELTLGLTGAYTDAKYLSYRDGLGNDLSQQKFQGIADFVYTLSGVYRKTTSFGSAALSIDYWHTSDVPLQPGAGPATTGGPTNPNPWATQQAYGLLNARAEVNFGDDMTLAVWGKNLANKTYFTYNLDVTQSFGYATSWGGAPRTWGAEVTYRF